MVELGAIEHGVVSEVVLEPASLGLTGDYQESGEQPSGPVVAKVPEDPPAEQVEEDDVSKQGNKEPRLHFEHSLCEDNTTIRMQKLEES